MKHWLCLANRRRTVVFATGVAHSVHIRDEFRRAGVLAEHIDGTTPIDERDRILAQLASGNVEVTKGGISRRCRALSWRAQPKASVSIGRW